MRIADREAAHGVAARPGFNDALRRHPTGFQRHRHRDRLHGRSGLESVGHGPITQLLATEIPALVRHVAGVIRQRQYFTGHGIQDHHTAGLSLVRQHRVTQLLISEKLHLAVDRQLQIFAIDGRHLFTDIFNHATQSVFDHAARTGTAAEFLVEGQLHAFLAQVFNVRKTHHVRRRFTIRVLALVLFALIEALDVQLGNLLGHRLIDLPLQPNKGLVFISQTLLQRCHRHFEQAS